MIILVGHEKGGCTKSTKVTNLAAWFADKGKRVAVLDADPQGTLVNWCARRKGSGMAEIYCVHQTGDILRKAQQLEGEYSVVFIDAGGRDSEELRSGMLAANLMIIPVQVGIPDVETMERMVSLIGEARKFNSGLQVVTVLSRVPNTSNKREELDAREVLEEYRGVSVARSVIRERPIYRDAMIDGCGVVEMKGRKVSAAKAEVQLLATEIFGDMIE